MNQVTDDMSMPVVAELVEAVAARDVDTVEACLWYTDPATLAVWCARLLVVDREWMQHLAERVRAAERATKQDTVSLRDENLRLRAAVGLLREEVQWRREECVTALNKITRLESERWLTKHREKVSM